LLARLASPPLRQTPRHFSHAYFDAVGVITADSQHRRPRLLPNSRHQSQPEYLNAMPP